jgi:flagellar hook assembly protein FlgD
VKLFLQIIFVALFISCKKKSTSSKACTQEAKAGLTVYVQEMKTNFFLSDSVIVKAVDGTYTETLISFFSNPPSFSGAFERTGNYQITVSKKNYKTVSLSTNVTKDECHVIPQTLTVSLQHN